MKLLHGNLELTPYPGDGNRQRTKCQTYASRPQDRSPSSSCCATTRSQPVPGFAAFGQQLGFLWQLLRTQEQEEDGCYGLATTTIEGFRHAFGEGSE